MQRTLQATCHGPGTNLGSSGMANSRATRSDVWEYFRKLPDDSKHVKCEVCDKKFAYLGGTTNLRTHLTSVHHINLKLSAGEDAEKTQAPGQITVTQWAKPRTCSVVRKKGTNDFIDSSSHEICGRSRL